MGGPCSAVSLGEVLVDAMGPGLGHSAQSLGLFLSWARRISPEAGHSWAGGVGRECCVGPTECVLGYVQPSGGQGGSWCHVTGIECPAGAWLNVSPAAVGSWRHSGDASGSERPRAGHSPGGAEQAGRGRHSQALLWVPGVQVRLWLLSCQHFLGLRCCLDSPVRRGQLSQAGSPGPHSIRRDSVCLREWVSLHVAIGQRG